MYSEKQAARAPRCVKIRLRAVGRCRRVSTQPRLRAKSGHLVARNRQHQPASFAFGGFARLWAGNQRVNLRLQFRPWRALAENPRRVSICFFAAGADIAVVHREIYGGRVFR